MYLSMILLFSNDVLVVLLPYTMDGWWGLLCFLSIAMCGDEALLEKSRGSCCRDQKSTLGLCVQSGLHLWPICI